MADERWQRVKGVFQSALDREPAERLAYVREACRGDSALEAEVESLLAAHARAGSFAERPPVDTFDDAALANGRTLQPGDVFGSYQIVGWIGAGGMGEVYRARDTKLRREVAIKMLPRGFTTDPGRLARFEREARILASLNHPHIGAIYSFELVDGVRGLVLELVEGPTLADRLRGGPLILHEALTTARRIADALGAAHGKGIIHRDLKPANVKFTLEGIVKVLDFGLAKGGVGDGPGPDPPQPAIDETREGIILGTAAYMSPEQARGRRLDQRTDIWAFGCVLYEMLVGRPPFVGETVSDTVAAIISREPDWDALPKPPLASVRRLPETCLEKDPQRRLRDLADARVVLDEATAPAISAAGASGGRRRTTRLVVGLVAGLALVTAISVSVLRQRPLPVTVPQLGNHVQLTAAIGLESEATWSPDGRTIAYESNQSGNWDIWILQIGSPQPVNRTSDFPGNDRVPRWAPNGREILFRSDRDGGGYLISPLGGPARRFLPTATPFDRTSAAWSARWFHCRASNRSERSNRRRSRVLDRCCGSSFASAGPRNCALLPRVVSRREMAGVRGWDSDNRHW